MSGKNLVLEIWGKKGSKRESKIDLFDFTSKSLHLFFETFYMLIEVNTGLLLVKTACLGKIWFSRYGAERGQNGGQNVFFDYNSKSLYCFFQILYMLIEANNALVLGKIACLGKFLFRTYRVEKGVKSTRNGTCGYISKQDCYMIILG